MELNKFAQPKDGFPILDALAFFNFRTQSSISLRIERHSNSLCRVRQLGWIDVHYPCEDIREFPDVPNDAHIKVRIHACLPDEFHEPYKLKAIIHTLFTHLEIPEDETYEIEVSPPVVVSMAQPVNRDGVTDRF